MGLIKAVPIEGRKRRAFQYRHVSPITDFAYYLNEKYGFFDADIGSMRIKSLFTERIPRYVKWFFEDLFAKHFGLQPVKIVKPELEVDIALREYKRIKIVAEVKWGSDIGEKEIRNIEEKLLKFDAKRLLIVPDKENLKRFPENIEVWDWTDLLKISSNQH